MNDPWDLTPVFAKYLDPQLLMGLLEFISMQHVYSYKDNFKFKAEILTRNNLIEHLMQLYYDYGYDDEVPRDLKEKYIKIMQERNRIIGELSEVIEALENLDGQQRHQFSPEKLNLLYEHGRMNYNCGEFRQAAACLNSYQMLITPQEKNYLSVLWGNLACSILTQEWKQALTHFNFLKGYIEDSNFTPSQALKQRSWLIHWGMFVFFNIEHGRGMLVELFFNLNSVGNGQSHNPYLITVQANCPHILRYITAAVITHKQRRNCIKELVRLIEQESYNYRDPLTEFVKCIFVDFDFGDVKGKLRNCKAVLEIDYFLTCCMDEFMQNARLFIFETYCRINKSISFKMIADLMNMSIKQAESWIVKLIEEVQLDAKVDSKNGQVIMCTKAKSPYQTLIEMTKSMRLRTEMLSLDIEKTLHNKLG